jgi:hypothetical protein
MATASGSVLMDFAADKAIIALQNTPTPSKVKLTGFGQLLVYKTIRVGSLILRF